MLDQHSQLNAQLLTINTYKVLSLLEKIGINPLPIDDGRLRYVGIQYITSISYDSTSFTINVEYTNNGISTTMPIDCFLIEAGVFEHIIKYLETKTINQKILEFNVDGVVARMTEEEYNKLLSEGRSIAIQMNGKVFFITQEFFDEMKAGRKDGL